MATGRNVSDLWGASLVEDIRRRFPTPESLPDEAGCQELWEMLRSRGCRPARPTRSTTAKSILIDIINGQDPPYLQTSEHSGTTDTEITPLTAPRQSGMAALRARLAQELEPQGQTRQDREIARVSEDLQALRTQMQELQNLLSAIPGALAGQATQRATEQAPNLPSLQEHQATPHRSIPTPQSTAAKLGDSIKLLSTLIPAAERFAGKDDRSIVEDLSIYEGLCEANDIPRNQWGQILVYVLKEDARRFFRTQPVTLQHDYERIKQAMIDRYLSPEKMDRIKMQYNNLSLKDVGSLEKYGEELLRLYKHLPQGYSTEAALIDKLILGVGQEEVTRLYRTVRPKTYAAAMELVRVWAKPPRKATKMLVADLSTPRPERPNQVPPRSYAEATRSIGRVNQQRPARNIEEVTCFNCNSKGHYASQCPHPRRQRTPRCGLCGMNGHFTRSCPHLSQDAQVRFPKL